MKKRSFIGWSTMILACVLGSPPGVAGNAPAQESHADLVFNAETSVNPSLRLVGRVPIPHMTGTWDHMAGDPKTGRVFMTAQDEHAIDVIDVRAGKWAQRLSGHFARPQGQFFITDLNKLVVTNGRDGTVRFLRGDTYELVHTLQLSMGADLLQFDPRSRLLYIESGGEDSQRGPGRVSVVDAVSGALVKDIHTGFRAAAMAIERMRPRLYVAIPASNQVALVDTDRHEIVSRFDVPGRPGFIGLDESNHRLFVSTRSFPGSDAAPKFNVIDTETGKLIASLGTVDGTSGVSYDPVNCRVYTTALSGYLQAFRQMDPDRYETEARFAIGHHAGTSLFMPELNRLFVAVPPSAGHGAELLMFEPTLNGRHLCN